MTVRDLPTLNAFLNATSAVLLVVGWTLIRSGEPRRPPPRHDGGVRLLGRSSSSRTSSTTRRSGACASRARAASGRSTSAILLTHTVLAAAVAPMAVTTFVLAWKGRFEKHRRLARWTLPIWLYVSVTGVVVYVMLYRMRW